MLSSATSLLLLCQSDVTEINAWKCSTNSWILTLLVWNSNDLKRIIFSNNLLKTETVKIGR